jgi:hypothetical protein
MEDRQGAYLKGYQLDERSGDGIRTACTVPQRASIPPPAAAAALIL